MWFSVWTALATGGGGGGGAAASVEALSLSVSVAFRNVLIRRKRTTTDFFINPPFANGKGSYRRGNYSNSLASLKKARDERHLRMATRLSIGVRRAVTSLAALRSGWRRAISQLPLIS